MFRMNVPLSGPPMRNNTERNTQRSVILRLLVTAGGGWVPLPEIMKCAAQYNTRIFELRRRGFNIENRTETVNGERHSWFRLVSSPDAPGVPS